MVSKVEKKKMKKKEWKVLKKMSSTGTMRLAMVVMMTMTMTTTTMLGKITGETLT